MIGCLDRPKVSVNDGGLPYRRRSLSKEPTALIAAGERSRCLSVSSGRPNQLPCRPIRLSITFAVL